MAETAEGAVTQEEKEYSESQIAVHWKEEEYYAPPEEMAKQANAADKAILEQFAPENFPDCFNEYAEMLAWDKKWDTVVDTSNPPFFKEPATFCSKLCGSAARSSVSSRTAVSNAAWSAAFSEKCSGTETISSKTLLSKRIE